MSVKKPKLNLYTKSLFLRFNRYVTKKRNLTFRYFARFPIISKEFLLSSHIYSVFKLDLRVCYPTRFLINIENSDDKNVKHACDAFSIKPDGLKNLCELLKFGFVEIKFDKHEYDGPTQKYTNSKIAGCRQVFSEFCPEAKINFNFLADFNYDTAKSFVAEFASRLHNLECPSKILLESEPLNLNSCTILGDIDVTELSKLLAKHKIRELKCSLIKSDEYPVPIPLQALDGFPTNLALRQLEIFYSALVTDENLNSINNDMGAIDRLPQFFSNLKNICLHFELHQEDKKYKQFEEDQIHQIIMGSLERTQKLREEFTSKWPEIKLEVILEFKFKFSRYFKMEEINKWSDRIKLHPELAKADRAEIDRNFDPGWRFPMSIMQTNLIPPYDYPHEVSVKWTSKNFTGFVFTHIDVEDEPYNR